MSKLAVRVGGLDLSCPITVASGTFSFGEEFQIAYPLDQLGAIITKTITLQPRAGNRPPRIVETPAGLINSIGLANPGIITFLEQQLPIMADYGCPVVVSIAGDRPGDYGQLARELDGQTPVAAIELNVSCPNVDQGGLTIGCDVDAVTMVVRSARQATHLPIWVKLTPNVTSIVDMAQAAVDAGADAVTLINTVRAMAIDINRRRPTLGAGGGGLSGPAIRPVAVRAVYDVFRAVGCDIIGCGGIMNGDDVLEFVMAGARAVSIGSGMFANPSLPWQLIAMLPDRMTQLGVTSWSELVGAAHGGCEL